MSDIIPLKPPPLIEPNKTKRVPSLWEACELKNVLKSGKSPQFSFPSPLPQDALDFLEFGKNLKFDDPPSELIWEKIEN